LKNSSGEIPSTAKSISRATESSSSEDPKIHIVFTSNSRAHSIIVFIISGEIINICPSFSHQPELLIIKSFDGCHALLLIHKQHRKPVKPLQTLSLIIQYLCLEPCDFQTLFYSLNFNLNSFLSFSTRSCFPSLSSLEMYPSRSIFPAFPAAPNFEL
jgi:hypothetical protein